MVSSAASYLEYKKQAPEDVILVLPYHDIIQFLEEFDGNGENFADPGQGTDRLYADDESGRSTIQEREPRPKEQRTRIWYGPIDPSKMNELRDQYNIIGVSLGVQEETEPFPVGMICGVCGYPDNRQNREWQPYAAAMAAAYAKAVLAQIRPLEFAEGE